MSCKPVTANATGLPGPSEGIMTCTHAADLASNTAFQLAFHKLSHQTVKLSQGKTEGCFQGLKLIVCVIPKGSVLLNILKIRKSGDQRDKVS